MIEPQRKRLERALGDMIEQMYKTHLKKMQYEMHSCAMHCCADEVGTLESVQSCIEKCALPLMDAQNYLQQELGAFHGRLQNCVKECHYSARNKLSERPTQADMTRSQHLFESCTSDCIDTHISLIPKLMKTIKDVLDKGPQAKITLNLNEQPADI